MASSTSDLTMHRPTQVWQQFYFLLRKFSHNLLHTKSLLQSDQISALFKSLLAGNVFMTSAPTCPRPYELIGTQCLFFSQPYLPWGLSESWAESYLNFYDAVALCRQQASHKGLKGDLATEVKSWPAAQRFCERARGTCAPSLIRRNDQCYQWSPIDGTEMAIECKRWEVTMRFICEIFP